MKIQETFEKFSVQLGEDYEQFENVQIKVIPEYIKPYRCFINSIDKRHKNKFCDPPSQKFHTFLPNLALDAYMFGPKKIPFF